MLREDRLESRDGMTDATLTRAPAEETDELDAECGCNRAEPGPSLSLPASSVREEEDGGERGEQVEGG